MTCSNANTAAELPPSENPTRLSLLDRLKNWEDQESWRDFFDAYWNLIYSLAIKSGLSDAEAQDVVQETVFCVANKMPSFQYDPAKGSFKSWLLSVTFSRIQDEKRKRTERRGVLLRPMGPSAETGTVELVEDTSEEDWRTTVNVDWENHLLASAMVRVRRRVDPKHFQAFDLAVSKNWPPAKIARTLGISRAAVYLIRHRMQKLIKKEVARLQTKQL